jgi:hypothetical protein
MYQKSCPPRVTNTGYKWGRDYILDRGRNIANVYAGKTKARIMNSQELARFAAIPGGLFAGRFLGLWRFGCGQLSASLLKAQSGDSEVYSFWHKFGLCHQFYKFIKCSN